MILTMFGIGVLFMLGMIFIGMNQGSFPFLYLGFFVMILLGMFLMSDGLQIDDAISQTSPGIFTTTYINHTMDNDPIVNLMGNFFFYFPFAAILLTTLYAIYR